MTVREALARARAELAEAGVESPAADAEWLLARVLGTSRSRLHAPDGELADDQAARFDELVARRRGREPLAYVLGEWGFRRLNLRTDRRALVPRPETEVVVDRCLAVLRHVPRPRVVDVGTGSGAIALAIADEHPGARVVAMEASGEAIALARENLERTGLGDRVELVEADFRSGIPGGRYDLVVANPPYVPAEEIATLPPEVRDWEPRSAVLDTGQSELVEQVALDSLAPGGSLVLETHAGRARDVAARLVSLGYGAVTITRDLAGVERVVEGRRA